MSDRRDTNPPPQIISAPLLLNKHYTSPSVFFPSALLDNARRQKALSLGKVPEVCVLDPDGDIVRHLLGTGGAKRDLTWACYHTDLYRFSSGDETAGVIGCAVGGPFAVLLAEQLFESGCELLLSITSAGQILPVRHPPYFVLIDSALRDEGASYHYLAPSRYATGDPALIDAVHAMLLRQSMLIERGPVWTTDAPFRETEEALALAKSEGILAVEMEAASLYAFAKAKEKPVICFAHITNQMGKAEYDFEKGDADGSVASLEIIGAVTRYWHNRLAVERSFGKEGAK